MDWLVSLLRLRARYPELPEIREFPGPGFCGPFSEARPSAELLAQNQTFIRHLESRASTLLGEFLAYAQPEERRPLTACQLQLQDLLRSLEAGDFSRPGPYLKELQMLHGLLSDLIRIHRIYGTCVLAVVEGAFSAAAAERTTLEFLELQDLSILTERFLEGLRLGIRFLDNVVCYEPLPGMPLISKDLETGLFRVLYRLQELGHKYRNFRVLLELMQDDWLELERQALRN